MICIKTGIDVCLNAQVFRADLHIDNGVVYAHLNSEPMEGVDKAELYVITGVLNRTQRPNLRLVKFAMTPAAVRKLEEVNRGNTYLSNMPAFEVL